MNNFLIKNNKNFGFTLVETLVAVSIFTMTLVAVMGLLGQGIADTNYTKNKITAEYLAQEGIEYIRGMRDTYVISDGSNGWGNFSAKITDSNFGCTGAIGCYFNIDGLTNLQDIIFVPCTLSCYTPLLKYNSTTGVYGYTSGSNSIYSRKINATLITADQIKITSTVSWMQGTKRFDISFTEVLFNWME